MRRVLLFVVIGVIAVCAGFAIGLVRSNGATPPTVKVEDGGLLLLTSGDADLNGIAAALPGRAAAGALTRSGDTWELHRRLLVMPHASLTLDGVDLRLI